MFQTIDSNQLKIDEEKKAKLTDLVDFMEEMEKKIDDFKLLWRGLKKSLKIRAI